MRTLVFRIFDIVFADKCHGFLFGGVAKVLKVYCVEDEQFKHWPWSYFMDNDASWP